MPLYTTDRDQTPTKRIATSSARTSRPARRLTPHAGLATTLNSSTTRVASAERTMGQAHVAAPQSQERPSYENLAFNEVLTEGFPPSNSLSLQQVLSNKDGVAGESHTGELRRRLRSSVRMLMVVLICLASFSASFWVAMRLDAGSWYVRALQAAEQGVLHARMAWYGQRDPHENVLQPDVGESHDGDAFAGGADGQLNENGKGQRSALLARHPSSARRFRRRGSQSSSASQAQPLVPSATTDDDQRVDSERQSSAAAAEPWVADVDKDSTQSGRSDGRGDKAAKNPLEAAAQKQSVTINGVAARAKTEFGSWSVSGSLESSKVQSTVVGVRDGFTACYMAAARHAQQDGFGTLDVAFNVDTQGLVREINVAGDLLPGLDMCVKGLVQRLSFGQPANAGITHAFVKVTYSAP